MPIKNEKSLYPILKKFLENEIGCGIVKIDRIHLRKLKKWRIDVIGLKM